MTEAIQTTKTYDGDQYPEKIGKDQIIVIRGAVVALLAAPALVNAEVLAHADNALRGLPENPSHIDMVEGLALTAAVASLEAADTALYEETATPYTALLGQVQRGLRATGRRLVEKGRQRGWLPLDIWVVAMEDDLSHYTLPEWLNGKVESIRVIRYLDRSTVTFLCSPTPTHYCHFFEVQTILKAEFQDDDELRSRAQDWVDDANRQSEDEGKYYDAATIDALLERNKRGTVYHWGNSGIDWDEAQEKAEGDYERSVRSRRDHDNYCRKEKGQPLLPVDSVTIATLRVSAFADEAHAYEATVNAILENVREAMQVHPCL